MKKYFKSLDLLMAAAELAMAGKGEDAAKHLANAAKSPDLKAALAALDKLQQANHKAAEVAAAKKPVELQMSNALKRLLATAKTKEVAEQQDQQDQFMDDDEDEETASDQQDDQYQQDQDDDSEEAAAPSAVTAEQDDQELDIDLDDERDDQDQDQDDELANTAGRTQVSARLARAERNKAKRA